MNALANFTSQTQFFGAVDPFALVAEHGSPLYVYNEALLRQRCREMRDLVDYPHFHASYSAKANANLALLQIVRQEGLSADAVSPGEIHLQLQAGFAPDEIFYVANNASEDELCYALDQGVLISVDSLAQLETLGRMAPGSRVAVRFNPGVGAGHHSKVITAGAGTKFGVDGDRIDEVKRLIAAYQLDLVGVNQHIGSLFMEPDPYLAGARALFAIAAHFEGLQFVDLGGGFGVPYRKLAGQARLDLERLGRGLDAIIGEFVESYGREIEVHIEPGRYLSAECGVLLGQVHAVKEGYGQRYVGTDIGFNVLMRPVLYEAHHDIEVFRRDRDAAADCETVTVVGNICETGDRLAIERELPAVKQGDLLGVLDAGAYSFAMASNYNGRPRPAEVLIRTDGTPQLVRRRESWADLTRHMVPLARG